MNFQLLNFSTTPLHQYSSPQTDFCPSQFLPTIVQSKPKTNKWGQIWKEASSAPAPNWRPSPISSSSLSSSLRPLAPTTLTASGRGQQDLDPTDAVFNILKMLALELHHSKTFAWHCIVLVPSSHILLQLMRERRKKEIKKKNKGFETDI